MIEDHQLSLSSKATTQLLLSHAVRSSVPASYGASQAADSSQRSASQDSTSVPVTRPPRIPSSMYDTVRVPASPSALLVNSSLPIKTGNACIAQSRAFSPQRSSQPTQCPSRSPLRSLPPQPIANGVVLSSSFRHTALRPQVSADISGSIHSPRRPISFSAPPTSPAGQQPTSSHQTSSSNDSTCGALCRSALASSSPTPALFSPRNTNSAPSSSSRAIPSSPRLKLGTVRYSTPVPSHRLQQSSPRMLHALPNGSPHVWFNRQRDSEHDITPYAEIYGVHPRFFNFNEQGDMIPPSPPSKMPKSSRRHAAELLDCTTTTRSWEGCEGLPRLDSPRKDSCISPGADPDPGVFLAAIYGGA